MTRLFQSVFHPPTQTRLSPLPAILNAVVPMLLMSMPHSAHAQASVGVYVHSNGERGLVFRNGPTKVVIPVGGDTDIRRVVRSYEKSDILFPGATGYLYNTWKDLDGDEQNDGKSEYVGLNKTTYYANESLFMRISAYNYTGHSATLLLLSPNNDIVWHEKKLIEDLDWYRYLQIGSDFAKQSIAKHGEGTYRAIFIIDDTCFGVTSFRWINPK